MFAFLCQIGTAIHRTNIFNRRKLMFHRTNLRIQIDSKSLSLIRAHICLTQNVHPPKHPVTEGGAKVSDERWALYPV